ncbi:MAG: ABC-type transport auxiliary lipoprotein family protein [Thermodesulfovibrionales bacterium]|nr:ABC-type transport auxiliary lipoprotein family protein [Thermodesulfovibrionales bacterium]
MLVAIFLAIIVMSCSTSSTKIYTISLDSQLFTQHENKIKNTVSPKSTNNVFIQVTASRHLRQTFIIDRTSEYEMIQSLHAKWELPPDELIKDTLSETLLKNGLFENVNYVKSASESSYNLKVDLKDFSRTRQNDVYLASLSLKLLLKSPNGNVVYQKTITKKLPCKNKSYHALAEAMSTTLSTVYNEIVNDLHTSIIH